MILGAFASFLFASCAKDYTCKCTSVDVVGGNSSTTTTIKDTKKDAKAACEALSSSNAIVTKTCTIQ